LSFSQADVLLSDEKVIIIDSNTPDKVFAKPYQVHMLRAMAVSGRCPSSAPWLPELRRGLEAIDRCVLMSRARKKGGMGSETRPTHFDHQTFTATIDRPMPKFLNRFPAFLTLATFNVIKFSRTEFVRLCRRKVSAEKLSPATKGLLEQ
jgi:hypothetical protein